MSLPSNNEMWVSHEKTYHGIYAMPVATLRHAHNKRRPRSNGQDRRGQISNMLGIRSRPREIEHR